MPTFFDSSDITRDLPTNYSSKLSASDLTEIVAVASGVVQGRLSDKYVTINDHNATPATPAPIKEAARLIGLAAAMRELGYGHGSDGYLERAADAEQAGHDMLTGFLATDFQFAPETKSGQAITPASTSGTESWSLDVGEALITSPAASGEPVTILRLWLSAGTGATDLTKMRAGVEFDYRFDFQRRAWIFRARESSLYDGTVTGLQVSYTWDYRRMESWSADWSGGLSFV